MDKLKLAALGERLKTGSAQMGRMMSGKMKEILQAQTPESKMVDEATLESLEEPNWGLNLRICAMLNSEEFSGSEIVKAIKKKIANSKNMVSQRLSLDLLETCAMNCEKVFSEVASEKLLDEMVRMIDNPQTHHSNRQRALQLIQAWGESEDLAYLPVFRQTSMSLKTRDTAQPVQRDGSSASPVSSYLESDVYQQPLTPPERYPIPDTDLHNLDHTANAYHSDSFPVEEKREFLVITQNSIEILSTILNSVTEPKPIKDELTVSMVDKCKQSQPVIQRIIESTNDDEVMLFEALNLHDELQQIISKYEEMVATIQLEDKPHESSITTTIGDSSGEPLNKTENEYSLTESAGIETSSDRKSIG